MVAKPLKRMFGLASVCVYGGVDKQQQVCVLLVRTAYQVMAKKHRNRSYCMLQVDLLKQQPSILIATPGRLLDLVDDQDCDLTLGTAHFFPGATSPECLLSWLIHLAFGL